MAIWTAEKLSETLKVMWNESPIGGIGFPLNFKDDHIVGWYIHVTPGSTMSDSDAEAYLYISVLHAGLDKYWGNKTLEHLCLVIKNNIASQMAQAFNPSDAIGQGIKWDSSLPEKHLIQSNPPKAKMEPVFPVRGDQLLEMNAINPNTLAHRISFVEILNPGNQLGYGWRCSCIYGLLCTVAYNRSTRPQDSYRDVVEKSKENSMFSLAVSMYNAVIHRVTIVCSTREDWDGSPVREFMITIPTGLGDQTRFYLAEDWQFGVSNPITDITEILVDQSLFNTRDGEVIRKLSQDYATGRFRSSICTYKDHRYGTNNALQKYLADGPDATFKITANAFCLLHKGMCIICANNNELALVVPSDV